VWHHSKKRRKRDGRIAGAIRGIIVKREEKETAGLREQSVAS